MKDTEENLNGKVSIVTYKEHCDIGIFYYSGTPLNGHTLAADTHDITDNSECPDRFFIDFNTLKTWTPRYSV